MLVIFQFTPLREGRRQGQRPFSASSISIHAPPRGATYVFICPRPLYKFQFTPLREGRLSHPFISGFANNFNSRPSARGDGLILSAIGTFSISIHAPPRGATRYCPRGFVNRCISIHAPPRGATCFFQLPTFARLISIHAPPRGATVLPAILGCVSPISIHAPPRGATRSNLRASSI